LESILPINVSNQVVYLTCRGENGINFFCIIINMHIKGLTTFTLLIHDKHGT
jgi:hypothetical protein